MIPAGLMRWIVVETSAVAGSLCPLPLRGRESRNKTPVGESAEGSFGLVLSYSLSRVLSVLSFSSLSS